MPWTIYRYIFKDLIKLLVTASVVLVLVISFAVAIKPLSEGLLGPQALLRYVLYLVPTMLGFVLPFAGAFASTLVFSRLVSDNELLVCRAGGISYRSILLPVVFLGLAMTLGLFYLGNWVVPSFYRQAATMLEKDIMQVIVSQVHSGRPVRLGDMVLYADVVDDSHAPPVIPGNKVQPTKLIRLRGVAVGQLDPSGRFRSDSTAQKADVLLYRVDGQTWATLRLENVVHYDALKGDLFYVQQWSLPQVLLPSPLKDDPRFLSWPQMRALGNKPELYDKIREEKQALAEAISTELILGEIEKNLADDGPGQRAVTLVGTGGGQTYTLTAPLTRRSGSRLELLSQGQTPVRVEYHVGAGAASRRVTASRGTVWLEAGDPQPEPWVRLELKDASIQDMDQQRAATGHPTFTLPRTHWPTAVLDPLKQYNSSRLLNHAQMTYPGVASVKHAAYMLRFQIVFLFRQVVAQLNKRAALAVSCSLLIVLGAVVSMKLGGGMPLVVYFWSFMSAIVVVIISHSGENLVAHPNANRTTGLIVIWLGNLLLTGVIGGVYLRLARN
jgi:lipopolysaccharide export system permease protein